MTTDNKLLQSILQAGNEQAQAIAREADADAAKILAAGRERADAAAEEIKAAAAAEGEGLKNTAKSNAALLQRNAVLKTKRAEIGKTLDGILDYIAALDDNAYFSLLYTMATSLNGEKGEILVNARDAARLPADFIAKMQAAGVNATLSDRRADIPCGFILKDGDIETSFAIDALMEDKRSELEDFINLSLFTKEG